VRGVRKGGGDDEGGEEREEREGDGLE